MEAVPKTSVRYALVTAGGRIVVDFGQSEQSMKDYIERHIKQYGKPPMSKPSVIHTVTTVTPYVELTTI